MPASKMAINKQAPETPKKALSPELILIKDKPY
jgi:hypothetical protein